MTQGTVVLRESMQLFASHDLILQAKAQTGRVDEGLMGCK